MLPFFSFSVLRERIKTERVINIKPQFFRKKGQRNRKPYILQQTTAIRFIGPLVFQFAFYSKMTHIPKMTHIHLVCFKNR